MDKFDRLVNLITLRLWEIKVLTRSKNIIRLSKEIKVLVQELYNAAIKK